MKTRENAARSLETSISDLEKERKRYTFWRWGRETLRKTNREKRLKLSSLITRSLDNAISSWVAKEDPGYK